MTVEDYQTLQDSIQVDVSYKHSNSWKMICTITADKSTLQHIQQKL